MNQQALKLKEEFDEVRNAESYQDLANESLHVATVAVGLAELAFEKKAEELGLKKEQQATQQSLQQWLDKRYQEKQEDFKEGLS